MQTRLLSLFAFCLALVASVPAHAVSSYVVEGAGAELAVVNGFGASPAASVATVPQASPARDFSRAERKAMRKSLREQFRGAAAGAAVSTIALIIIAIFIPPLAMLLYEGGLSKRFWISLLLTLLFFLPGLIYTIIVIAGGK